SKVITLHALDDGLVIPENEEKYFEVFNTVGRTDQLVQLYTPAGGHCGFTIAEHVAALTSLFAWVEHGMKPTVAIVQAACTAVAHPGRRSGRVRRAHRRAPPEGPLAPRSGVQG